MIDKEHKIEVQTRKDEKNSELRRAGIIPAVLYGNKTKNQNLKLKRNRFEKVFSEVGESGLIELNIDSKNKINAVVKEVQKDYVKNIFIHVDFYQVDMKKEIEVEIILNFIGESEAVKNKGGVLARNLNFVKVRTLPEDLIDEINVDLSSLKELHDKIKVSDLKISDKITMLSDANTMIVNVLEPKVIKEIEKQEVSAEEEKSDGKKEEKKDGEEKPEGKKEEKK